MIGLDESVIVHETAHYWVKDVGPRGFEVYQIGLTHSTRVGIFGRGERYRRRAIDHCERLEKEHTGP